MKASRRLFFAFRQSYCRRLVHTMGKQSSPVHTAEQWLYHPIRRLRNDLALPITRHL